MACCGVNCAWWMCWLTGSLTACPFRRHSSGPENLTQSVRSIVRVLSGGSWQIDQRRSFEPELVSKHYHYRVLGCCMHNLALRSA